jgi:hypothetical protein
MKPTTPADVVQLLDAYAASAALGAALEHHLFWLLADEPKDVSAIAERLGTRPPRRERRWSWTSTSPRPGPIWLARRATGTRPS